MPQQVNVRVDDETVRVLTAAAFVANTSVGELVRSEITALATRLGAEPAVKTALRAREEHEATQSGTLASLESKRRPRDGNRSA